MSNVVEVNFVTKEVISKQITQNNDKTSDTDALRAIIDNEDIQIFVMAALELGDRVITTNYFRGDRDLLLAALDHFMDEQYE